MMSPIDIWIKFTVFIICTLFMTVVAAIGYIIYRMIRYKYPRIFTLGHSEDYDTYMPNYLADLLNTIIICAHSDNPGILNTPLAKTQCINVNPFMRHLCRKFLYSNSQVVNWSYKSSQTTLKYLHGLDPKFFAYNPNHMGYQACDVQEPRTNTTPQTAQLPLVTPDECTPQRMPALYMYFIYKEAIEGKESASELKIYRKFFGESSYAEGIDNNNESEAQKLIDVIKIDIAIIHEFFDAIKSTEALKSYKPAKKGPKLQDAVLPEGIWTTQAHTHFDVNHNPQNSPMQSKLMILASYRNNILKAYDFRKSGGPANFKLFKLLMRDYIEYVFIDMIPAKWKDVMPATKTKGEAFMKAATSPAAMSYMTNLPAKIAGVSDKKEKFTEAFILPPPGAQPDDTVEFFGFLKPLIQIPKFFMTILNVAKALATAITNPLKAMRIIIGLIVGTFIYILYIIVTSISFIMYAVAFIYVACWTIVQTMWILSMFGFVAAIYLILWILDYATGGIILPLFRCENLPHSWHTRPGFFFNNKYRKGIFCHGPCRERFLPTPPSGSWCERMNGSRPAFCPQQLIYQYFDALLTSKKPLAETLSSPLLYEFKPMPSYFTLDDDSKKQVLEEFVKEKYKFMRDCYANTFDYKHAQQLSKLDEFNDREHNYPEKHIYDTMSLSMCQALTMIDTRNLSIPQQKYYDKLARICHETYCHKTYEQHKRSSNEKTFDPNASIKLNLDTNTTYSFCDVLGTHETQQQAPTIQDVQGTDTSNMPAKFFAALATLFVIIGIAATLYKFSQDHDIDIQKIIDDIS